MSKKPNTPRGLSTKANQDAAASQHNGSDAVSRRDFIRVTAATGIVSTGIASLTESASAQEKPASTPENSLQKSEPLRMFEGTVAAAALEQLKAAGIRTIFHTNTSGYAPLWDAVYSAGDVQVIMVTHEGQGVAAAAGYALASKGLGFFAGSGVGLPNSLSNLYCAWKDRVPLIASYTGGGLGREGEDAAEDWDHHLKPAEPFTNWTGDLLTNSVTAILRRAIKFAFGPPSGPVALDWGNAAEGQRIKAPIYKMDLANARSSFRAKADLIQKAAQWLAEAENPVFLVGPEVSREGAGKELQLLAEKLAVPVAVL